MWKTIFLTFCLWIISAPAWATSSIVNLPVHHWVYDALARLSRIGLISESFLTLQPMRRDEAARLVALALENRSRLGQDTPMGMDWTDELLTRLKQEFREELQSKAEASPFRWRTADTVEVEMVGASLDGLTRQPLENSAGRSISEGPNGRLAWRGWVQAYERAAITLELEARARDSDADLIVNEGSAKLDLFNMDLEVGRDRQWWGPGEHGALILSDNAPPMDMIRISNAHPSRLPWVFSHLGSWKWVVFVSRLEHDRDHPWAKLGGARLVWSPIGWIELGATRTLIFGGQGGTHFSLKDSHRLLYGVNFGRFAGNDNLSALDITVYLPMAQDLLPSVQGTKLYLEYGAEDWKKEEILGIRYRGPVRVAYLMGLSLSLARADLRLEYADNTFYDDFVWYRHHFYTDGYTFENYIIGHEMGGGARDLSLQATFYLTPEIHLLTSLEQEVVGFGPAPEPRPEHPKVTYAGQIGLNYSLLPRWEAAIGYRYEHVIHPEFEAGTKTTTHLLTARVEFHLLP